VRTRRAGKAPHHKPVSLWADVKLPPQSERKDDECNESQAFRQAVARSHSGFAEGRGESGPCIIAAAFAVAVRAVDDRRSSRELACVLTAQSAVGR
jgi:hypothetical protein